MASCALLLVPSLAAIMNDRYDNMYNELQRTETDSAQVFLHPAPTPIPDRVLLIDVLGLVIDKVSPIGYLTILTYRFAILSRVQRFDCHCIGGWSNMDDLRGAKYHQYDKNGCSLLRSVFRSCN